MSNAISNAHERYLDDAARRLSALLDVLDLALSHPDSQLPPETLGAYLDLLRRQSRDLISACTDCPFDGDSHG